MLLGQLQEPCSASQHEDRSLDQPLSFGASSVSMGQFSLTVNGIQQHLLGIDVESREILAQLTDNRAKSRVLAATSIIYLEAMNGVVVIRSGRQASGREGAAPPPCLPLQLINTSVVDFVSLVSEHKSKLRIAFEPDVIQKICQQHKDLLRLAAQEPPLMKLLESKTRSVFAKSWAPCGSRFHELQLFAAGLATVMPTTSRVEGDFSLMGYRRNSYCSGLTDYSLEGVLYAKQYQDLQKVATLL